MALSWEDCCWDGMCPLCEEARVEALMDDWEREADLLELGVEEEEA